MLKLIAIDPGHGPETAGKRTPLMPDGTQIQEYQFNVPTARYLEDAIQRCGLISLLTADGKTDVPLAQRVGIANNAKADIFVSIHYNAFRGVWDETEGGVETHHYPNSTRGKKLADLVHKYVAQGTEQINRGVKESNFYVLRETQMPAILVENGFMDVRQEAVLMLNPEFQKEQAEQIAQGICEYFGVKYVPDEEEPAMPASPEPPNPPSQDTGGLQQELLKLRAELQAERDKRIAAEEALGAARQQLERYRVYFQMQLELQQLQ